MQSDKNSYITKVLLFMLKLYSKACGDLKDCTIISGSMKGFSCLCNLWSRFQEALLLTERVEFIIFIFVCSFADHVSSHFVNFTLFLPDWLHRSWSILGFC